MILAERILSGDPERIVLDTGTERLTARDLAACVITPNLAEGVAVSIADTASLMRLLAGADGRTASLLLLAPSLPSPTIAELQEEAGIAHLVSDRFGLDAIDPTTALDGGAASGKKTAWLMTTSGTTGRPKIVRHQLEGLLRTAKPAGQGPAPIWGLLYDPSRFAGMQVVLQSLAGGGRLIAPSADAPMSERLALLARCGATHLSATPTLWRRILMEPGSDDLTPTHITLGGEIADRSVLDALARRYPNARIRHIYASTELGVGFSVRDGLPGFPARWAESRSEGLGLRIRDGMLWIRPEGPAPKGLGDGRLTPDADGFYPTGDQVRQEGDRVHFLGRGSSVINIGGTKIQPEEVERILQGHPDIAIARIGHRPSPIAGALLTLTVVPRDPMADPKALRRTISAFCREHLQREAMPAKITIVSEPEINAAGKLSRNAD